MNRIVCPKCRANNMPGQTSCFQCGSSLPPPEAAVQHGGPISGFPPAPSRPPWQVNPWALVIPAAVVVVLFLGLVFTGVPRMSRRQAEQSLASSQAAELDRLRREHGLGANRDSSAPTDDETRRELDRLRTKYGINSGNPHNPNDGSVPNGGAMTFDQWRRQNPDASSYQFH